MTFKISKSVGVSRVDAFLNSTIDTNMEAVEFEIAILSVKVDADNSAMATYSISANGKSTNDTMYFTYEGSNSPIVQAESILMQQLNGYE